MLSILMIAVLLVPLAVIGAATIVLACRPVQRLVCSQASEIISEKLGAEARIGGFFLNPFTQTISLEDVYLEDLEGDTIISLARMEASISLAAISSGEYGLRSLSADSLALRMVADSGGVFGYERLFGLGGSTQDNTGPSPFHISISRLCVRNMALDFSTDSDTSCYPAINFSNLKLRNINLIAHDIDVSGQDIEASACIDTLSASERCGLEISRLAATAKFSSSGLRLGGLLLNCPATMLEADSICLEYSGLDDFSAFTDSVRIAASIREGSTLGLDDLGHFVSDLHGYGISPMISASVRGPVADMDISGLDIRYGACTRLSADAQVKGLPDVSSLKFSISLNQLKTCQADLASLHQPGDTARLIAMPGLAEGLGTLSMQAKAKGTSQNCQMSGIIESRMGSAQARMEYAQDGSAGCLKGFIDASALDLGALSGGRQDLGLLSTSDSVVVLFGSQGSIRGHIEGRVDSVGLMGYYYRNIKLDGDFTEQSFDGSLSVKDPCLDLDFDGIVDIGEASQYKFALDVSHADLKATNLMEDSVDKISFGITANLSAANIDNIVGTVQLTNMLKFERNSQTLYLNSLKFKSIVDHYTCGIPERVYTLSSDFADLRLSGRTYSAQILEILSNFAYMILPSLNYSGESLFGSARRPRRRGGISLDDPDLVKLLGNKFDFSLRLKDMDRLAAFFMPELKVSDNTIIEGGFNTLRKNSWASLKTGHVAWQEYSADSLKVSARLQDSKLAMAITSDSVAVSGGLKIKSPAIEIAAQNDTLRYSAKWDNSQDGIRNEGMLAGNVAIIPHALQGHFPVLSANLGESYFYTWGNKWEMPESRVTIDSTSVNVNGFALKHGSQYFEAAGTISENPAHKLTLKTSEFDLSLLNHFLGSSTISGNATGTTSISNVYGNLPLVEMCNSIDTLKVNDVVLGAFEANLNFHPGDSVMALDFYTLNKMQKKNLHGYGGFNIQTMEVDFSFDISNMSSKVLRPLFENYLTVPSTQFLDGHTRVWGPLGQPKVESALKLKGGYFKIDYLGAKYTIQDALNIAVNNQEIKLEKVKLLSGQTGLAYLEGKIDHRNFSNFKMAVDLQLKNFTLLSTQKTDSAAFWGKAFASGNVKITGDPTRMINIDAKVKTEKNTRVSLPLYGASEVSGDYSFVTFKKAADTLGGEIRRQKADLSDIRMSFKLEVTPEAEVEAILDASESNKLTAAAAGNLNLDVTGSGDFSMYGTLSLEKGDYLFNSGPISKKFEVVKGGTLRWRGDPLDADADIQAMYRLRKVNLYNLMVDESYRDKKVPVQCLLKMKGNIMTPEISFGVKLEDNGGVAQGQIDNLDEGNINKQMISLLLLNQFQPLPGLKSSENSMFSDFNAGEIVSNKINSMLSDISDKFDVGVNYQMGDGASTEELDVAVSTQLFDERVQVSTNLGVSGDSKNQARNNTNSVVGEVEVEVKLNKSGSMKLNVYNKANEDELQESPYKQGISFSFKKEVDSVKELWRSLMRLFGRREGD